MRRLAIFCFYDRDGIVDSYIEYLLDDLINNVDCLVIVVNGILKKSEVIKFEKYTERIIIRKNEGFDVGAYADVIVNIIGKDEINTWDEIVLCNDTFYGPFLAFKNIFDTMKLKEIDFWGMGFIKNHILNYIPSYFLVFRKKVVSDKGFYEFFVKIKNRKIKDIMDAYAFFEVGIFDYLVGRGYKYDFYKDICNYNLYNSADICIEQCGLPILKKKAFDPQYLNLKQQIHILRYLSNKTKYKIEYILSNIYRLYGINIELDNYSDYDNGIKKEGKKQPVAVISSEDIKHFIKENNDIYIYGTGTIARKIWCVYFKYILNFKGFLVSDDQEILEETLYGFPIQYYGKLEKKSTIIIGLGPENTKHIRNKLKKEDKILFLW